MIGKLLGTICKFVGGFVLICLLATACLGGEPKEKQEDVAEVPQIAKDLAEEESVSNIPEEQSEIAEEEGPNIPFEFNQALDKAQSYVDLMAFSQADLRGQLEYHEFSFEAIEFALENVDVDYQAECIEKAESYLELTSFSEEDLREQLEYHKFNEEHINVAIEEVYR
jgi:hypothetical protein